MIGDGGAAGGRDPQSDGLRMIDAIRDELTEARSARTSSIPVHNGRLLHATDRRCLYDFETEQPMPPLPPESPISLLIGGGVGARGTLVSVDDFRVLVELRENLGAAIPNAELAAEPWFVLEKLRDRLVALREPAGDSWRMEGLERQLLGEVDPCRAGNPIDSLVAGLNDAQRAAIRLCSSRSLHFVWGPPGTGKTATLAATVRELVFRGERVLVLAHSNVAVDVSVGRIADALVDSAIVRDGELLRLGVPVLPQIAERYELLPEGVLAQRNPELLATREKLLRERKELWGRLKSGRESGAHAARLHEIRELLYEIEVRLVELQRALVSRARIVGATLARLVIDDLLWSEGFDAVVVDEVSMASFAHVYAAASRASTRLLLFGDARQLPPVHLATTPAAVAWLGRDAFQVARVANTPDDPRISFLSHQYRMGRQIAEMVSDLAYDGRLVTPSTVAERVAPLASLSPAPDREVVVVDTSVLRSICVRESRPGSWSRINPVHVSLAVGLVQSLERQGCRSVSVISPYRAQAVLVDKTLRAVVESTSLRAATVHRFQGMESDVVIVDLVDAPPQRGASRLTGIDEDTSRRLLNVALSRARGKLIVLADVPFVMNQHPPNSPARRFLQLAGGEAVVMPSEVIDSFDGTLRWFERWSAAQEELARDLVRARRSTVVNLPSGFDLGSAVVDAVDGSASSRKLFFAPYTIGRLLERTDADLRLMPRPVGALVIAAPVAVWFAGDDPERPVARLAGGEVCEAVLQSVFGDVLNLPAPSAEREERLDRACGRCPKCGGRRRPRRNGREWILKCSRPNDPGIVLGLRELGELLRAASVTCPECGGWAVVREGKATPIVACEGDAGGCKGQPPTLDDLFGQFRSDEWPT